MTKRNRISIELSDLIGLGFECGVCGTNVTVPIRTLDIRMLESCPNCGHRWGIPAHKGQSTTKNHVDGVIEKFRALNQQLAGKDVADSTLTLEVAPFVVDSD